MKNKYIANWVAHSNVNYAEHHVFLFVLWTNENVQN